MKNELRHGVPKAAVARKYGLSRQSIYNILNEPGLPTQQRAERGSLLDPFRGLIDAKLAEFDVTASSLFLEINQVGK